MGPQRFLRFLTTHPDTAGFWCAIALVGAISIAYTAVRLIVEAIA